MLGVQQRVRLPVRGPLQRCHNPICRLWSDAWRRYGASTSAGQRKRLQSQYLQENRADNQWGNASDPILRLVAQRAQYGRQNLLYQNWNCTDFGVSLCLLPRQLQLQFHVRIFQECAPGPRHCCLPSFYTIALLSQCCKNRVNRRIVVTIFQSICVSVIFSKKWNIELLLKKCFRVTQRLWESAYRVNQKYCNFGMLLFLLVPNNIFKMCETWQS